MAGRSCRRGVRSVEAAQRCRVALFDAAAQCLRVECGSCGIHRVLLSLFYSIAASFPRHRQSTVKARNRPVTWRPVTDGADN